MRRPCKCPMLGLCLIGIGLLLVLAVILPGYMWWLVLGLALICAGALVCKR